MNGSDGAGLLFVLSCTCHCDYEIVMVPVCFLYCPALHTCHCDYEMVMPPGSGKHHDNLKLEAEASGVLMLIICYLAFSWVV
jgi:hypothetical protein